MAYDIGPKIGIDGEAEFRKSIQQISQNIKTLGTEMSAVTSAYGNNEKSVESLAAQNKVLEKTISAQEDKLSKLKDGLEKAADKFGEADTKTLKWQAAVNQATADLNKMKTQLSDNAKAMDDLASGTDDFADFKQSISQISKNIKTLGTELDAVKSAYIGNEKSVESLTAQNKVLEKTISAQEDKLSKLKEALAKAADEFGEAGNNTQDWQMAVNQATSDLNKMKAKLSENKRAMEALGDETEDVADSLDDAKNAGSIFGDVLKANVFSDAIMDGIRALSGAFKDFAKEGISLASDLLEVQNVIDVTFGQDGAKIIEDFSKSAANNFGLSELSAKQFTGTLGAMLKSMGLNDSAVRDMSTSLAGLAGDMASFYNLDPEEAFEKLRSGISGETEPLKQLGINMSVANLEAYALSQGIETAYNSMSQAEQATLRYNYLMQATADAQGDFARTSDSYANQQRILELNMQNLASTIGSAVLPYLTEFTTAINAFVAGGSVDALISGFQTFLPVITSATAAMVTYKTASTISGVIEKLKKATESQTIAQAALNAVMNANPFVLIATLIASVVTALVTLYMTNEDFRNKVNAAWKSVRETISGVVSNLVIFFTKTVPNAGREMLNFFKNIPGKALQWGKDLINNFVNGIKSGIGKVKDAVLNIANTVKNFIGFSEPKYGPLSNFHTYAPDMMELFVKGIRSNEKTVQRAMENALSFPQMDMGNAAKIVQRRINSSMAELTASVEETSGAGKTVRIAGQAAGNTAGASDLAAAVREALNGAAVYMDGRKVGRLVTAQQRMNERALGGTLTPV